MNISDRQNYISKIFKDVHKNIFDQIKMFEDKSKIQDDVWHKKELGNGNSVVIDDGNFFDKAGINFSSISVNHYPSLRWEIKANPWDCLFLQLVYQ